MTKTKDMKRSIMTKRGNGEEGRQGRMQEVSSIKPRSGVGREKGQWADKTPIRANPESI